MRSRAEYSRLKLRYRAPLVGALLGGLVFAAALSWVFAFWLAGVLHMSWGATPLRDEPQGWLWGLLLIAFFMLALYASRFGTLALLTRHWAKRYCWSREQTKKALFELDLPEDWFRPEPPPRSPASGPPA